MKHIFFILITLIFTIQQVNAQQKFKCHKVITLSIDGKVANTDVRELDIDFYKPKQSPLYENTGTLTIYDKYNFYTKILEIQYLKETKIDDEVTKWYYIVNNKKYGFNVLKITNLPKRTFNSKYMIQLEEHSRNSELPLFTQTYLCN